jgi:predicted RNA binding protein YcfA (HicA-like mRNA interferase family)
MKNNNTLSRQKISKIMSSMGLQEIISAGKNVMIYGNKSGTNIVPITLQKGRCHLTTFRNALQNMTKKPPVRMLEQLAAGQTLGKNIITSQPKNNKTYKPFPPLQKDLYRKELSYNETIKMFQDEGWQQTAMRGSHRVFKPQSAPETVAFSLTHHGNQKPSIPVQKLVALLSHVAVGNPDPVSQTAIHSLHQRMVRTLAMK